MQADVICSVLWSIMEKASLSSRILPTYVFTIHLAKQATEDYRRVVTEGGAWRTSCSITILSTHDETYS